MEMMVSLLVIIVVHQWPRNVLFAVLELEIDRTMGASKFVPESNGTGLVPSLQSPFEGVRGCFFTMAEGRWSGQGRYSPV